jgi:hypothetical protein
MIISSYDIHKITGPHRELPIASSSSSSQFLFQVIEVIIAIESHSDDYSFSRAIKLQSTYFMVFHFLERFPREIRDQIYLYVLACPSGSVSLFPWIYASPNLRFNTLPFKPSLNIITGVKGQIDLSLLRTCKQIHRECKDIIWKHNGLLVQEPSQLFHKFTRYTAFRRVRQIQHLKIHLELLDCDELEWMSQSLKALVILTHEGSLESIRLVATSDRRRHLAEFEHLSNLKKHGESMDGRWYRAASLSGYRSLPQRALAINTGWPRFSHWGKQNWLRQMLRDPTQPIRPLWEMHDTFAGELYVNGQLWYKDHHVEVAASSQLDPGEGEIMILPSRQPRDNLVA